MMQKFVTCNFCIIVFVFIVRVCDSTAMNVKAPRAEAICGKNWTMYKDEKCLNILQESGLMSYEEAGEACHNLPDESGKGSSPRLLTVKSEEEQDFVNKFLFTGDNEVVDHVWLGLSKNEKTGLYEWNDGGELLLTNWAQRTLTETNLTCVQMETGETSFGVGQWVKVSCKKRNVVVCEKLITWPLDRVQNTMMTVKRQLATASVRHEEVYKDINDLKKQQLSTETKLAALQLKQETSDALLLNMQKSLELMEQKLIAMTQRNKVMDEQMNLLRQVTEVSEQTFQAVKREIHETKEEYSSLHERLETVENQIVTINEKLEIVEERMIDYQDKKDAENRRITWIRNDEEAKITRLKQISTLEDKLTKTLEAKLAEVEEKINDLRHKHTEAAENFDFFRTEIGEKLKKLIQDHGLPSQENPTIMENKAVMSNVLRLKDDSTILAFQEQNNRSTEKILMTEKILNDLKLAVEKKLISLETRIATLEKTLGILETNHRENENQNVAFVSHTVTKGNSPSLGAGSNSLSDSPVSWQESSTPQKEVTFSGSKDSKPIVPQNTSGVLNSESLSDTSYMLIDGGAAQPAVVANQHNVAINTVESKLSTKLDVAETRITKLEQNCKKFEQKFTMIKNDLEIKMKSVNGSNKEVTKETITSMKHELEESIKTVKENLELKITVLEQRSDVSEQLFVVLKRDTTLKLASLEQKLTASQVLPVTVQKQAQPQEAQTQQSQETLTLNLPSLLPPLQNNQSQERQNEALFEAENQLCNAIPVGFTYVQLPGQAPPAVLWPLANWTEISTSYAGLFFRVVGGEAAPFGEVQEGTSPLIEFRNNLTPYDDDSKESGKFGNWSAEVFSGNAKLGGTRVVSLRFRYRKQEVRGRNTAIKIWLRVKESIDVNKRSTVDAPPKIVKIPVTKKSRLVKA